MFDADYRDVLPDALECMAQQTVLDQLDVIFLEWTSKRKPEILKYDFIKLINMNLTKDESQIPCFDNGIQWNLGLYLAQTPWVTYDHNDIYPADHYEKIIHRIENTVKSNKDVVYIEGHLLNEYRGKLGVAGLRREYNSYKTRAYNKPWLVPDLVKADKNLPLIANASSLTVNKPNFIKAVDGWCWNLKGRNAEFWIGPGQPQPNLENNQSVRQFLISNKKAIVKCPEIYQYAIPHPRGRNIKHIKSNARLYPGGRKYYSDFIKEWIPTHRDQLSNGEGNG